jgi:hypothetical protein
MKTKIEIINETAEFYSKNPRAVRAEGKCVILTSDNRTCAYGRCMVEEAQKRFLNQAGPSPLNAHDDANMQPKYRGHGGSFWKTLQRFHDMSEYWDGGHLTSEGEATLQHMRERFNYSNS